MTDIDDAYRRDVERMQEAHERQCVTRPAENQQTVEALERHIDFCDHMSDETRDVLRAALRDLVAQAAELRAFVERIADEDCGEDGCVECFDNRKATALLARLDGVR